MTRTRKQLGDFRVITYHLRNVPCILRESSVKVSQEFSFSCEIESLQLIGKPPFVYGTDDKTFGSIFFLVLFRSCFFCSNNLIMNILNCSNLYQNSTMLEQ